MRQIWTIGHWTCPESTFMGLLAGQGIEVLADVRAHPGSRKSPQFGQDLMPRWLARGGIDYVHLDDLGGRRPKQDVDPDTNAAWNNVSFKNYADYTLLPAYHHGIARLEDLAEDRRVAIMCAEPMPWRCHRLLVSNTLTARDWTVQHVIGATPPRPHQLGQWGATPSVNDDGQLTYPAPPHSPSPGE